MENLQLLKLGGSLITDKSQAHTARQEVISRLAGEIAKTKMSQPELKLVVGHGSGSFGHVPGHKYATRQGVKSKEQWLGFVEVWREAAILNRLIADALASEKLPAIVFSPLASVTSANGKVVKWNLYPLQSALRCGLIPVVYGDVVFDTHKGGTILSTEDLFDYLIQQLKPQRVLLAGLEPGVWQDFPECKRLITEITPQDFEQSAKNIFGSSSTDVTGGMLSKVNQSLQWVQNQPNLEVFIFSAETKGTLERVLSGERAGTRIFT